MYFDGFEKALFARDDRLINLGLAQFASKKDIIVELYKHGCSSEDNLNPSDCIYYQGLRLACLANEVVGGTSGWLDDIQIKALIDKSSNDSWCEINTLFTNPNIPDRLLETLYTRTEVFANLKDRVWLYIVEASRFNPRLNLDKSNDYSPDLRFRGLHNDIFGLTEIAPVSVNSLLILSSLIGNLDLNIIDRPNVSFKKINSVLARWKDLVKEKKFSDGYYTHLSLEEEFRCLIALIYGQGSYWDSKNKLYEFINNEDIALRCIYYANAEMNVKEMEVAFKLDDSVFIYAMLHNDKWIYDTHKHQRIFLEEHIWGGEVIKKYMQRCEQIQKKFKTFDTYPITDIMRDLYKDSNYATNKFEFNTFLLEDFNRDLIKRVDKITKKILGLFFFIIILLCINFFFK